MFSIDQPVRYSQFLQSQATVKDIPFNKFKKFQNCFLSLTNMGSCLGQNMVRAFVCIHYIRTLSTNLTYKKSCVSTRRILICTNLLFCLCLFFGRNTELHISKLCTFDVSRTCRVHVDPTPGHVSTSACQYKFRKSRKQDFSNLKKDNALECCRR